LSEGLLAALPGYKGPDVYSRGADPEGCAYFFTGELERGPRVDQRHLPLQAACWAG
jgi:hypothetical protein